MPKTIRILELRMPGDFSRPPYLRIYQRVIDKGKQTADDIWLNEFIGAWKAVAYRFRACVEHSQAFTRSVQKYGDAPIEQRVYIQDRELTEFFFTGLSCMESLAYGLSGLCSLLDKTVFPFTFAATDKEREKNLRDISLGNTLKALKEPVFTAAYPTSGITDLLDAMMNTTDFDIWQKARNTVTHRTNPGRIIYASTIDSLVEGGEVYTRGVVWKHGNIPIDTQTTETRRKWLADNLRDLLKEIDSFTRKHF